MKIDILDNSCDVTCHNADEYCVHETCSEIFSKYYKLKIGELIYFLPVCDKHEKIIEIIQWDKNHPT